MMLIGFKEIQLQVQKGTKRKWIRKKVGTWNYVALQSISSKQKNIDFDKTQIWVGHFFIPAGLERSYQKVQDLYRICTDPFTIMLCKKLNKSKFKLSREKTIDTAVH